MEKIVTPYVIVHSPEEILCPPYDIKAKDFTCFGCKECEQCEYAFDPYNTNGDCLAMK